MELLVIIQTELIFSLHVHSLHLEFELNVKVVALRHVYHGHLNLLDPVQPLSFLMLSHLYLDGLLLFALFLDFLKQLFFSKFHFSNMSL